MFATARIPRDGQQHCRDPLERGLADGARRLSARHPAPPWLGHHRLRVPQLAAGERPGLFAMEDALVGALVGRDGAVEAADSAAGWLPSFASALHRAARGSR